MNKKPVLKFAAVILLAWVITCTADQAHMHIKIGSHEKVVNNKYGSPIIEEKLSKGFLPFKKKKALYKVDSNDYFIIKYFSGRVKEVDVLEDFDIKEAKEKFRSVK